MPRQARLDSGILLVPGRRKDGRDYYRLRYHDAAGRVRYTGLGRGTNDELNERAREFLRGIDGGREPVLRNGSRTVAQAWMEYEGDRLRDLRKSTQQGYASIWRRHLEPEIGALKVREVRCERLREVLDQVQARTSRTTRNRVLEVLKAFFQYCGVREWTASNPATGIRKLPTEGTTKRGTSRRAVHALLAELEGQDRVLVHLLAATGLRLGEALGLEWGDLRAGGVTYSHAGGVPALDFELHVNRDMVRGILGPPKTDASIRTVPITDRLHAALTEMWREAYERGDSEDTFVFRNTRGAGLCGDDWRKRKLVPACARAKVSIRPKDLRDYAITRMITAGNMNLLEVQRIAGHTMAETTMGYFTRWDASTRNKARTAAADDGL